ncbi:NADH-quinone oxidoreductase subunit J [Alcaligenaceae bacterium]|nr:NADH-quinone oxidoreductase subunit J [Alcaligenaceae bacterium]
MIFSTVLFYMLALVLVVAAFRVITATSPVTGVLHLILTFFTAAMIWMTLGAEFVSLLLVVVYVGAVMVLFLFVIMMLDVRMQSMRAGLKAYLPLGLIVGLIMVLEMGFVLVKTWFDSGVQAPIADNYDNTHALGVAMYTDYVFAVQVGGVVLLVGMISAIVLTMRRRADYKRTHPGRQVRVRSQDRIRMVSIPSQTEAASNTGAEGDKK